jgi:hypothetical protein
LFKPIPFAGIPIFILDERHGDVLNPWRGDTPAAVGLELLRRAQIGRFRNLRPDPDFREVTILDEATEPVAGGATKRFDPPLAMHSELTFRLGNSQFVYAIRLKYSYGDPERGSAVLKAAWMGGNNNGEKTNGESQIEVKTGLVPVVDTLYRHNSSGLSLPDIPIIPRLEWTDEKTETFWVNGAIDEFRIYPDDKARLFRPKQVTLLVPLEDPSPQAIPDRTPNR